MEELNGRMIACQILITGLIARVANDSKDPLRYLSNFRDEIHAVVRQVRIAGALDNERVRQVAVKTVDELFSLMKPPNLRLRDRRLAPEYFGGGGVYCLGAMLLVMGRHVLQRVAAVAFRICSRAV